MASDKHVHVGSPNGCVLRAPLKKSNHYIATVGRVYSHSLSVPRLGGDQLSARVLVLCAREARLAKLPLENLERLVVVRYEPAAPRFGDRKVDGSSKRSARPAKKVVEHGRRGMQSQMGA